MPTYAALLRGINVGGKSLIRMADLRACFEDGGFDDVATYIASGNVVFGSAERGAAALTRRIERMLADRFELDVAVVLRTRAQMRSVVEDAPTDFGTDPSRYRSDVIFLKSPLTPAKAMEVVRTRDGVDQAWRGRGVLYFSLAHQPGDTEPHELDRRHTRLPADDDPELEDHDDHRADARLRRIAV